MRALYFGTYDRRYPRNALVVDALRRAGVEVVERHEGVWEAERDAWRAGPRAAFRLLRAQRRLRRRVEGAFDVVVVGYPGHLDIGAARRALPGVPLVLNPLVSLTDTFVADRGRFRAGSVPARLLGAVDRRAFAAADVVVADTEAHAQLFRQLGARTVEVAFVGADERIFHPPWQARERARVLFVGKLIPLHGVETIVAAAHALPQVAFRVVGSGQRADALRHRPPNVEWVPWVDYDSLGDEYRGALCALGIFGTSEKAARVIPNKAFQALACGTPLVTADTPAVRELLDDGVGAALVPPGDAAALARRIGELLGAPHRLAELGAGGLDAYRRRASAAVLAERWRAILAAVAR